MATLRYTFPSCNTSCSELAKLICDTFQNATMDGIYYNSVEVRSSGDTERDKTLMSELKSKDMEVYKCTDVVKSF